FATGRREIENVLRSVEERFPDVPRKCALDFGCGVGRLSRALAGHFERVFGVDAAESMIRQARQMNSETNACEFILNERADLEQIASASVDFVYSSMVLQHIEPVYSERYIGEFVRVLTPRGLAVFQIPYKRYRSPLSPFRLIPGSILRAYRDIR